jgi:hypothetical protein
MRATRKNGYRAEIVGEGSKLDLFAPDGSYAFSVAPPASTTFREFVNHTIEGMCPLVSFELAHSPIQGMDWYCKVTVESKSIELLNPAR